MKKVLVIIDMQNDFIDGPLGNDECKQAVPAVIDAVNNGGYTDVILTRDTHGDNYLNTQEGRKLPVVHCIKGTDGWQINSDIMKSVNASYEPVIIDKPTFASLELGEVLSNMVSEGDVVGTLFKNCHQQINPVIISSCRSTSWHTEVRIAYKCLYFNHKRPCSLDKAYNNRA